MKYKPIQFSILLLLLASLACTVADTTGAAVGGTTITPSPTLAQAMMTSSPTALPAVLPSNAPKSRPTCTVSTGFDGGAVNVRACPSVDCTVVGWVGDGDVLLLLEGGAWVHIETGTLTGYLNSRYCVEVQK